MENIKSSEERMVANGEMKSKFKKFLINIVLPILALLGIVLCIELTVVYFNANFITGAAPSFCAISDTINCDSVARTAYSHFLGVPLSLYGLGFYSLILLLSMSNFTRKLPVIDTLQYPTSSVFFLSGMSLIISAVLAAISSAVIHKICVLCYLSYVVNILIFITSIGEHGLTNNILNAFSDYKRVAQSKMNVAVIAAVLVVIVAILSFFATTGILTNNQETAPSYKSENRHAASNILGSKNPKVVIDEYTDFECPYCSISNTYMNRIAKEVNYVQVVHHDFPLNSECNPAMKIVAHKNACVAALYARAAKKQGKYRAMVDMLFDTQYNLSEQMILQNSKGLGFNMKKLEKDAHDAQSLAQLKSDAKAAADKGVKATPTYFINGKKYEGLMPYEQLKKAVESAKK